MMRVMIAVVVMSAGVVCGAEPPNVLIITVDDMSADSLGAFGCTLPDTSPHIDRLAESGMRFRHAHVVVGNCMPSRNVMWSGLYPHHNGVEGFYQVPQAEHPHLVDLMQDAGYHTAIFHKVSHSTPYHPYGWDSTLEIGADGKQRHIKDAASYGEATAEAIAAARAAEKPFCVMMNISDPHKPLYAEGRRGETVPDPHVPTRVFSAEEVPVPGFLFDDPVVRKELSHYYSSVRRADDCVGAIVEALDASGRRDETLILFLSDHGMPLPFAKTQLYHHSSHTPLFVIWPGVTEAGATDDTHMVSAVDLLPTLLDVTGLDHPERQDGRSFAALLRGEPQDGRDVVIKEYNENAGASRDPMRAIQSRDYLYLYNPWSDGERVMATATTGTSTYRRLAELAETDSHLAARHDLYRHRVPQELYRVSDDPDCLHNLIDDPAHREQLLRLQARLEQWMVGSGDPMLEIFRRRDDRTFVAEWMAEQEAEALRRRARKKSPLNQSSGKAQQKTARPSGRRDLIAFELPQTAGAGEPVTVMVRHSFPEDATEQTLTVTMKGGRSAKRIDRKTVTARGRGVAEVTFDVPDEVPEDVISFAAFVGTQYQSTPQHIQSPLILCNGCLSRPE